jgi:predicted metal-dependent phosphoesterase TrpH
MKIDLHTHTFYSIDGCSSPEDHVRRAAQRGLDGVAITDHNTTLGWKEANAAAKKYNIFVVQGEEVKTKINGKVIGDIVALFIKHPIEHREPEKVIKEIHDQGGLAILAHPFHIFTPFKGDMNKFKDLADAIEVLNGRVPSKRVDKKALAFAKKHNLAMVGSSDSHYWRDVADAYTYAPEAKNLEDFKQAIINKKTRAGGGKSPLISIATPLLAKFKVIGRPPRH